MDLWDNTKSLTFVSADCRVPEGEEKRVYAEKIFEKIIARKLSKYGKEPTHLRSSAKCKLFVRRINL